MNAKPEKFLLAGVMGWPVMHSRSPKLHNYWFAEHGLSGAYVPLAIPPENLQRALRALVPLGFSGCNLTIPHKEAALAILDEVDPAARRIGAVNCVVARPDGSLFGTSTDGYGFLASIQQEQPGWRADAGPVVVIGAGGGSRAVVWSLAEQGATEIRVVNRSFDRARELAEAFGGPVRALPWRDRHAALDSAAILVNTTSQGMAGQEPLDLDLHLLPPEALVADIVYVPRETPLLAAARRRRNPTVGGLGMLIHQARPAWKAWFGIEPEVTPVLRTMMEAAL